VLRSQDHVAEQLTAAFEHAPSGVAVISYDGRLLRVNRALLAMLGRPEEEVVGARWQDIIHPSDLPLGEAAVAQAFEETGALDVEVRTQRPDGKEVRLRITARAVEGSEDNPARLVAHYEDVTERRERERELDRIRSRLDGLVDAAPDAVVMKDTEGRIVIWNTGAQEMFGLSAQEAVGRLYPEVVLPPEEVENFHRLNAQVLTGHPIRARMKARRSDGSEFLSQVSVAPVRSPEGRAPGTVAIIRDITDVVEAEQTIAERAKQLERSNAELEDFAYAASHDLQEPLRSIEMAAGTVLRAASGRLDEDERGLLGYIDAAAGRMSDQVAALMHTAQVALGGAPAEPISVDLAVDDALAALRAAIRESGAEISVSRPLPSVGVPRAEMALVLQNLIANAIKFRRPGEPARVTVSGSRHDGYKQIEVSDQGIGLTEDECARIFDAFERGRPDLPGIGMGLAVVRRILDRRGGSISVTSTGPDGGARFTLRLPVPGS
jgi:PAS domain S-box-containing protein